MSDVLLLLVALIAGAILAAAMLVPALRQARGMVRLLEGQLNASRHQQHALADELAAARDEAAAREGGISSENAELRQRMDELADLLMRTGDGPAAAEESSAKGSLS